MTANTETGDDPGATATKNQATVQLPLFAIKVNRDLSQKLTSQKKVTLTAAVLAFAELPPAKQIELVNAARVQIAAHWND